MPCGTHTADASFVEIVVAEKSEELFALDQPKQSWSFAEVLRLMYDKERTGILDVSGPAGQWEIHLRTGQVVNLVVREGQNWNLGNLLIEGGALTDPEMLKANKWAKKSNESLEAAILHMNLVTKDVLRRYVVLDTKETLFPLFDRVGITCRFRDQPPILNDLLDPIPVSFLLKEASRRLKLTSKIDKAIKNPEAVYGRKSEFLRLMLGGTGSMLRTVEGNEDDPSDALTPPSVEGEITANERIVFYYLNGKKTVTQVARTSGLGLFETKMALCRLLSRKAVGLVHEQGQGEVAPEKTIFPVLFRISMYLLIAGIIALTWWFRAGNLINHPGLFASPNGPLVLAFAAPQLERIRRGLDVYFLENGNYPESLADLVNKKILFQDDIDTSRLNLNIQYRLSPTADAYQLSVGDIDSANKS